METYYPGTRLLVFDARLFKNDKTTPLSVTMKPCTVVKWYGKKSWDKMWDYPSLVDVIFDHRPDKVSKGHFADKVYVERITVKQ